jgi:hypothetical protein
MVGVGCGVAVGAAVGRVVGVSVAAIVGTAVGVAVELEIATGATVRVLVGGRSVGVESGFWQPIRANRTVRTNQRRFSIASYLSRFCCFTIPAAAIPIR